MHESLYELTEEYQFASAILDTTGALIVVLDMEGRIVQFNRACERITGYSFREARGRRLIDWLVMEEEREDVKAVFDSLRAGRFPNEHENHWLAKDGTARLILWSNTAIQDEKGLVRYIIGTGIDVTESREVRKEHCQLVTAIEQATESFIVVDTNQVIQYVNPAFERLTGYTREEAIRAKTDLLASGSHEQVFFDAIWHMAKSGLTWNGRIVNRRKDGRLIETETTVSPVKDPRGRILDYVIIKRDMSEVASLERQLRQAQKMEALGTLAGGIAHDFNNLLSPIIGYTDMALDQVEDGELLRRNLRQVKKAAYRAKDLVKQILVFSRQTEQEQQPVQVSLIVKEALKLLRASLPSHIEIRQDMDLEASESMVLSDPTQVHQILMNLCTNGAHAMRENGGVLDVTLAHVQVDLELASLHEGARPGLHLKLTVRDTGHGMEPSVRQNIFEPYFTTKDSGEGTGMGLAVVYGIVQGCKGFITVWSEPGLGSAFEVFLPATTCAPEPELERQTISHTGHGTVLLVDDDRSILDMVTQMLKRLGYEVHPTTSPTEALDLFAHDPDRFRLVITDQTMPHMLGTELARELYRIRPDIPVILCTGFSELIDEERARNMGLQGFLMKPVVASQISRAIQGALNENKGWIGC